jgi:hypothetical protein
VFSQVDSTSINTRPTIYIGLELFKPLHLALKGNSTVIEPEFTYQKKNIFYKASFGYATVQSDIYRGLDYKVVGTYLKLGIGIELDYFSNPNNTVDFLAGANLISSRYDEAGNAFFEGNYFEDLNTVLTQKHSSRGMEVYFTIRKEVSKRLFFSFTTRYAYVISKLQQEEFPIYYAPGFGVLNILGSQLTNDENRLTGGLSIKLEYQLR